MVCSRCIHRFSSLSRINFDSLVSGDAGMKVATLMIMPLTSEGEDSEGHLLKCLATVVSLSWEISKMFP